MVCLLLLRKLLYFELVASGRDWLLPLPVLSDWLSVAMYCVVCLDHSGSCCWRDFLSIVEPGSRLLLMAVAGSAVGVTGWGMAFQRVVMAMKVVMNSYHCSGLAVMHIVLAQPMNDVHSFTGSVTVLSDSQRTIDGQQLTGSNHTQTVPAWLL